ncbi:hypothetical protein ACFV4G_42995 [Kitasatospora sp. NPDC059747]|uniref:hypothetical protein n=1 Tax=Kitasatospora sp. NPDC059747 TaxID=3346930 RepID=UPI00365953DE
MQNPLDLELQLISSEEIPLGATSGTGGPGGTTADCPPPTVVYCTSGNTYGFMSMCSTCC